MIKLKLNNVRILYSWPTAVALRLQSGAGGFYFFFFINRLNF